MRKIIYYLLALLTVPLIPYTQSRWNGGGPDDHWGNPLNWASGMAPMLMPAEDILLDNSLNPGSYTVRISGSDSLVIHSLQIAPDAGKTITVIIDTSSVISTALTVTSNEKGIFILNGGIFINASGSADGTIISITDSLRIENGGAYIHRTRRAHTALVSRLSRIPGTEKGVFEFNIPSASNTLSLSNQVYGTLRLSNREYGKNVTYSGGAAGPLYIMGDLELQPGVSFSLNFSDTMFVKGNLLQTGGIFNIANSTRASVIQFYGNIEQSAGVITKTGTAIPSIILSGNKTQYLRTAEGVTGDIVVKINNQAEVRLLSHLIIHYLLELKGGKLVTTSSSLVILKDSGQIKADSTVNTAFVDGPLRKEGLMATDYFRFPVGKNFMHRWLAMKGVTGNFTVEYFRQDPHLLSDILGSGIDHISTVEYWILQADAVPQASGSVILSYNENSSGGVTDLETLRVAKSVYGTLWNDAGNESVTGSAGSSGSVQSNFYNALGQEEKYTFAGSAPLQNPLPLKLISFTATREKDHISLKWEIGDEESSTLFELQRSGDGHLFEHLATVTAKADLHNYQYNDPLIPGAQGNARFYRLKIMEKSSPIFYSKVLKSNNLLAEFQCSSINIAPVNRLNCTVQSEKNRTCRFELFDMTTRRLMLLYKDLQPGNNTIYFDPIPLPAGAYIMRISDKEDNIIIKRFIR